MSDSIARDIAAICGVYAYFPTKQLIGFSVTFYNTREDMPVAYFLRDYKRIVSIIGAPLILPIYKLRQELPNRYATAVH